MASDIATGRNHKYVPAVDAKADMALGLSEHL
ncbi:hypothetical protein NHJ13734_007562, partial [Beauveria thailandica]